MHFFKNILHAFKKEDKADIHRSDRSDSKSSKSPKQPEWPQHPQQQRSSFTESIRKRFGRKTDVKGKEVTFQGRPISSPILPAGGWPWFALVKPTAMSPKTEHPSERTALPRDGGIDLQRATSSQEIPPPVPPKVALPVPSKIPMQPTQGSGGTSVSHSSGGTTRHSSQVVGRFNDPGFYTFSAGENCENSNQSIPRDLSNKKSNKKIPDIWKRTTRIGSQLTTIGPQVEDRQPDSLPTKQIARRPRSHHRPFQPYPPPSQPRARRQDSTRLEG
ncbi:hypothetical protein GP486_006514 [Trichoglossum hirsutum]|uniref:Uncharacterized protein n=1 Tax=Trichoglossum hirsutum TaxID=265104 RepID=A0A9P8L7S9_9PEZI|nr:hypothetical protein GP486_006514 [Trichoglossum hirsutum]